MRAATVTSWFAEVESDVRAQADYLTQLDAAIGDGDHGINMTRGFDAVGKALAGQGDALPPGRVLILAGKTLVSTVGGASGPLYGTALRRMGRSLGDAESFDGPALADALDEAVSAAADAAEEGARATVPMQARKGRASYLGERSVGHQDPGATSCALILRGLERALLRDA